MKKNSNYCHYLVAFIDILGQKEAFYGIDRLPQTKEEEQKLIKAHSETVLFIEELWGWFEDYFKTYKEVGESQFKVPEAKKEQFDEMRKVILKHTRFSDCIQAFVPLQSEKYHSPRMNGIFGILGACGGMLLLSFARKKPFRAGIDIGIATELTTGEAYGPGFFNAYALESKIAQYPRIVIGDQLINYLMNLSNKNQQLPNQVVEDIELCKIMADNCRGMIVRDLDGYPILDYLGDKFADNFTENLSEESKEKMPEIFNLAFNFIESEYKRRRDARDRKLASRYFMLYNYFKAKKSKMAQV